MKTCIIKNQFLLPVLTAGLGIMLADPMAAQTFTTLYSFTAFTPTSSTGPFTNSDGAEPSGPIILSGGTLCGIAQSGGTGGNGTVFRIAVDGTDFTNLHSFTALSATVPQINEDGSDPIALALSGTTLYGVTIGGGSGGNGTVFKINTDGTLFTNLHSFTAIMGPPYTNDDGASPLELVLLGSNLYGTTASGGSGGGGTVFKLNLDGTGFTTLHNFTAGIGSLPSITNSDGIGPNGLVGSETTLYGTTFVGGESGNGTLFKLNTDGTGFSTLYTFTPATGNYFPLTNSDGVWPKSRLALLGNTLYGTAYSGGSSGNGTLFKINTDSSGFLVLHTFTGGTDGANPEDDGLIVSGGILYAAINVGGSNGNGTVLKLAVDGTGLTTLHSFTGFSGPTSTNSDGSWPECELAITGNTLYGTASFGGSSGNGTIFSISLPASPPQLAITPLGQKVILTWPTNAIGFTLQSTTNLGPSATWTTNSPAPLVVNGLNTVSNSISGIQQFFRLSQ